MAKKNRINNSDPSINLRLPKELKDELAEKANQKNQTVSKYVRELFENYFSGDLCKQEMSRFERHHFITSIDFLQLVAWVYEKRRSNKYIESDEELLPSLIHSLKRVGNYLPNYLTQEFDKVLYDVLRSKNEPSSYSKDYVFCGSVYSKDSDFNYEKLENFIKNLEFPLSYSV